MSPLGRAALAYAERYSWPVFPLTVRGKEPMLPRRKGGQGFKDATIDTDQIRAWWRRWPEANIGVAVPDGLLVVDVDPRNTGDWEMLLLESEYGKLPDTPTAITGGGGLHIIFRGEAGGAKLGPGVDIKAAGCGYIVAAPSVHPSGRRYLWEASLRLDEVPIADAPAWIIKRSGQRRQNRDYFEHKQPVDPMSFALGAAFKEAGMLGEQIRPGVWATICPNADQHSAGKDFDTSTVIFAPGPNDGSRGRFHCSHEHCRGRWQ